MALFAETAHAKRTTKTAQNVNVTMGGQDRPVHIVQEESGKIRNVVISRRLNPDNWAHTYQ